MKKILLSILLFCFACSITASAECDHVWGEWEIFYDSTCNSEGSKSRMCTKCHKEEKEVIPKKDHVWGDWEIFIEARCDSDGYKQRTCTNCYTHENETIPAIGHHSYGEWKVEKEPTCTSKGSKIRTCSVCSSYEEAEIPATGKHVWSDGIITQEPSCTKAGKKDVYCITCGATQEETVPAYGAHQWTSWKISSYSSKQAKRYCEHCDASQTKKIKITTKSDKAKAAAEKPVATFFKYAKSYNTKKMKSCFVSPAKVKLFVAKKYMAKFFKSINKKYLTYDVSSVKVKGNTATVKVICRYYDGSDIFQCAFSDVFDYLLLHPKASSLAADKYQYKQTSKYQKSFARDYGIDYSEQKVTFKLKKVGKNWKISSYTKTINDAIHCNYQSTYDKYF